jgi:hypothetical protein
MKTYLRKIGASLSDISQQSSDSVTDASLNPRLRRRRQIETVDIAESLGFNLGWAFMCLTTHGHHAEPIEELRKAIVHIEREISRLEKKGRQRGS